MAGAQPPRLYHKKSTASLQSILGSSHRFVWAVVPSFLAPRSQLSSGGSVAAVSFTSGDLGGASGQRSL
jgi:hypothetical protein